MVRYKVAVSSVEPTKPWAISLKARLSTVYLQMSQDGLWQLVLFPFATRNITSPFVFSTAFRWVDKMTTYMEIKLRSDYQYCVSGWRSRLPSQRSLEPRGYCYPLSIQHSTS